MNTLILHTRERGLRRIRKPEFTQTTHWKHVAGREAMAKYHGLGSLKTDVYFLSPGSQKVRDPEGVGRLVSSEAALRGLQMSVRLLAVASHGLRSAHMHPWHL